MVSTCYKWMQWIRQCLSGSTSSTRLGMTAFRREKLLYEFNTFLDENHDGVLEERDLNQAAERLCHRYRWPANDPRALRAKALMKDLWLSLRLHADEDQDDKVTRTEWLALWTGVEEKWQKRTASEKTHLVTPGETPTIPSWIREYFHYKFLLFDVAGDGVLDEEEFVYVMTQYGAVEAVAKKAWFLMTQGRLLLRQDSFEQLCEEFFLSDQPTDPGTFLAARLYFLPGEQRDNEPQ
ncbi:sarcoplasmic calcium-binding proteins II, V, VI, and VII-like [Penaeus japonicus]|uniref:sarcoplasmic calcium-binding proteins II, V, VI, and VII-like n=1 Tax=Penaeus japonicus TaxID=27405 RepID=UPI001C711BC5|nr:sarcoplasmic calcium-binding proteins II, V, VI, and VII-like [Penaeus japonicus]